MGLGAILLPLAIQFAALLAPIAAGLAGLISGAVAGLTSILAWFIVGIPLSYLVADVREGRQATARRRGSRPTLPPASGVLTGWSKTASPRKTGLTIEWEQ